MTFPLRYYAREALASFARGGAMSLAAVLTLMLAGFALGGYDLLRQNTQYWMGQAESRLEVVVYFKDGIDQTKATALAETLKHLPEVQELSLVSPADAAKELSKDGALAKYFDVLGGENPLPWSARIKPTTPDSATLNALSTKAQALDGVNDVDWGQDSAEALLKWIKLFRSSLLLLGLALSISAALMTASVTRLTVHARRDEIAIMRMVGASPWFIRAPFLLEGLFQGLLGGVLGAAFLASTQMLISAKALSDLQLDLSAYLPYGVTPLFSVELVLVAAGLGFLGSVLAVGGKIREGG